MTEADLVRPPHPAGKKIAYVIGRYPSLTKTFIDREILEARRLGLAMTVIATRKPEEHGSGIDAETLGTDLTYLFPCTLSRFLGTQLTYLCRRPLSYLATLIYLATRSHPSFLARLKTLLHFSEGVLACGVLRGSGVTHIHAHFADRAVVIAMVVRRLMGLSYSVTAHAHDIYRAPPFLEDKLRHAKFATTCTAFNRNYMEDAFGRPVELIYHGLDFVRIRQVAEDRNPQGPPLILSIGRLQEKKGFPNLIRACHLLVKRGCSFVCEIVGEGPARDDLAELIEKLGLGGLVTLSGAQPHENVLERYSQASMFVLPCIVASDGDRDGIPNVILEAMAFHLPVVSTNVSGIPEVITDGTTGRLVAPGDSEALADAIQGLLDYPAQARALGKAGAGFVRREFDIRRNVSRLIELLIHD